MKSMQKYFKGFEAEGTVFGCITKKIFQKKKIYSIPKAIVDSFEKLIYPLDQKIEENEKQNEILINIRDALLPKLMSGQIRVPVEEFS